MATSMIETIPTRLEGVQYRAADVEHLDLEEGTILMRAAPYDVEVPLGHRLWESFAPKTFAAAANAPTRCKLWNGHGSASPIGHAKEVEDRPDGLWIRARFSKTVAADEARELAADGTLDQCSIEFMPRLNPDKDIAEKADGLHIRHRYGVLLGVALVPHGAYADDAFIASVRDMSSDKSREALIARLRSYSH